VSDNNLIDDELFRKYPVMIHANPEGTGATGMLEYGKYTTLPCMDEDDLTGIVIRDRYTAVDLYQDDNLRGKKLTLTGPLSISHMGEQDHTEDWEDDTKSLEVRRLPMSTRQKYLCCNAGASEGACGEFHNNKSMCDNFMLREYCPRNSRDPICSCINFSVKHPELGVNPSCIDKDCITRGYKTQSLQQTRCPSIINCTMQNKMANSGIQIAPIVRLEQDCGERANTILDDQRSNTGIQLLKDNWLWIAIGFIVLIVLIVIIGIIASVSKKKTDDQNQYYDQSQYGYNYGY
jgi:hypothetical protein